MRQNTTNNLIRDNRTNKFTGNSPLGQLKITSRAPKTMLNARSNPVATKEVKITALDCLGENYLTFEFKNLNKGHEDCD